MFVHDEDYRVCNKYAGCVIPRHECLFSLIGLYLPFNDFKVDVLNCFLISHSQLHPVSWDYVKYSNISENKGRVSRLFSSSFIFLKLNVTQLLQQMAKP